MRLVELQSKDVINIVDGSKVGSISDVEINWCHCCIESLVVEQISFFHILCFFKDPPVTVVPVECIVSLDGDVILVNIPPE